MPKKLAIVAICLVTITVVFIVAFRLMESRKPIRTMGPDDARSTYEEASTMMRRGDYPGAIKGFQKVLKKYPDSGLVESSLYALASIYEMRDELLRAREIYGQLLEKFSSSGSVGKARSELDRINMKVLFSPAQDPDSFIYEVKPGDTLSKVAKTFNTTVELLMKANNLRDGTIKIGKRLKVTKLKFSIAVDKSQNILTLKGDGRVLKTYQVATGVNNCTPVGTFKIVNKVVDPVWYAQDAVVPAGSPKNILGSRWMGISHPGYGIHGSTDPSSIGKQATAGCVRMHNRDVEELYAIVPVGTEVVIED